MLSPFTLACKCLVLRLNRSGALTSLQGLSDNIAYSTGISLLPIIINIIAVLSNIDRQTPHLFASDIQEDDRAMQ